jgi:lipase ATG15
VTGHSLGGGLAIITGSQTQVAAVALSGPNAMLSRNSFQPPLSVDHLDQYTFVSFS